LWPPSVDFTSVTRDEAGDPPVPVREPLSTAGETFGRLPRHLRLDPRRE